MHRTKTDINWNWNENVQLKLHPSSPNKRLCSLVLLARCGAWLPEWATYRQSGYVFGDLLPPGRHGFGLLFARCWRTVVKKKSGNPVVARSRLWPFRWIDRYTHMSAHLLIALSRCIRCWYVANTRSRGRLLLCVCVCLRLGYGSTENAAKNRAARLSIFFECTTAKIQNKNFH